MPATRTRHEDRWARHTYRSKEGLTVRDLRHFLALVDEAEVADDSRVHIDRHVGEGGVTSGWIEARTRIDLDAALPPTLAARRGTAETGDDDE